MSDSGEWNVTRVHQRVIDIRARNAVCPPSPNAKISSFREAISDLPAEWQGLTFEILTQGLEIGAGVNANEKLKFKRDSYFSGGGFLLMLLGSGLTFVRNSMSPQQSVACCALISAGIATFLVFLPGFLKLQGKMAPNEAFESLEFKGGGAAAIFVLAFVLLHFGVGM